MAVLKIKASTLIESLVALLLVLLLFTGGAYLLHQYYYLGIDIEQIQARNATQSLGYFYRFDSPQQWEKRLEEAIYPPIQYTVNSTNIEFVFPKKEQQIIYYYVIE